MFVIVAAAAAAAADHVSKGAENRDAADQYDLPVPADQGADPGVAVRDGGSAAGRPNRGL